MLHTYLQETFFQHGCLFNGISHMNNHNK